MLVLDYLRSMKPDPRGGGVITIPAFHTGILGFIPGTAVFSNLTTSEGSSESWRRTAELLVSPFTEPIGRMFHMEVLLEDRPGVVLKVLEAIHRLGLNIVKQESTIINTDRHHFVQFVLDWGTSELRDYRPSLPADRFSLSPVRDRIPTDDARYVCLYKELMLRCAEVIWVDQAYGRPVPSILIRPFCNRRFEAGERQEIRASGRNYSVELALPPNTIKRIRESTDAAEDERIPYLIGSYALHRTLRIFFPSRAKAERSTRLAFYHRDREGAVELFTSLLKECKFNIWTSLLRKIDENVAVLEVLVTYTETEGGSDDRMLEVLRTGKKPPTGKVAQVQREIRAAREFAQILSERAGEPGEGGRVRRALERARHEYGLRICSPGYPHHLRWDALLSFGKELEVERTPLRVKDFLRAFTRVPPQAEPRSQISPTRPAEVDTNELDRVAESEDVKRRGFASVVRRRIAEEAGGPSRIFLSYPVTADKHADLVKTALERDFCCQVVEYQEPNFADITRTATTLIQSSDYFIGIWHHELASGRLGPAMVSPWMPFEYGVAVGNFSTETPTGEVKPISENAILLFSELLPKEITRRIQQGFAHPSYSDLTFESVTLRKILDHAGSVWRLARRPKGSSPARP